MTPHPYASDAYAGSLRHLGAPIPVPEWGTPLIARPIPGADGAWDATGPYPRTILAGAADLAAGLARLREAGAVTVTLVPDPLTAPRTLSRAFDLCRPFKTHQLLDRDVSPFAPTKHHRDRIRRGARRAEIHAVDLSDPRWLRAWRALYDGLRARRGVTGAADFPDSAFATLATLLPGNLLTLAALSPEGETLCMQIWVRDGDRAHSHLTATSEAGMKALATYAVTAAAVESLPDCRLLDFGGGAGHGDDPEDGLARFKAGFANATATAHLCGAVLDRAAHARLCAGLPRDGFFPPYRAPRRQSCPAWAAQAPSNPCFAMR